MIVTILILACVATAALFGCTTAISLFTDNRRKIVISSLFCAMFLLGFMLYINAILLQVA